jgi:hypothetical protein
MVPELLLVAVLVLLVLVVLLFFNSWVNQTRTVHAHIE